MCSPGYWAALLPVALATREAGGRCSAGRAGPLLGDQGGSSRRMGFGLLALERLL